MRRGRVHGRRIRILFVAALAVTVAAPRADAVVTPTKVLGGAGQQFWPFATDDWLTFAFYDGGRDTAMAQRRPSGTPFKMNETGTSGLVGGIDPGTDTAIYQQYTDAASTIYLYDLGDRTRRQAPGINSRAWEWSPRISARYLSFFRNRVTDGVNYIDLYLYRRDTKVLKRIAVLTRSRFRFEAGLFLWNGGVGRRYATWIGCAKPSANCDVFVYDALEKTTKVVHGGGDQQEYAPAIDEANGFLYFVRSGAGCGAHAAVWRIALDHLQATPTKVADLPDGYDAGYVASANRNGDTGGTDYYFGRGSCDHWNEDIYVAAGVDTA
jgi:hypothetical protein